MEKSPHGLFSSVGATLLELLHREEEGELSPAQQQLLDERKADPDVQAARTALRRAVMFLSGPNPPLPRSVAVEVASQVQLGSRLTSPLLPRSVSRSVAAEVALSRQLTAPPPRPCSQVRSVAAPVVAEITGDRLLGGLGPVPAPQRSVAASLAASRARQQIAEQPGVPVAPSAPQQVTVPTHPALVGPFSPAPLWLVGGLLTVLTLMTLITAWPNLVAGAVVLHTLLEQVSPLAGSGFALLLLTSALIAWKPTPQLKTAGAGAFFMAAVLTVPALYHAAGGSRGPTVGQNVTVSGPVRGNVIAIAGNVELKSDARVEGEVVTLLGDVRRDEGAEVSGRVNALLGQAHGDKEAIQTRPVSVLSLATAAFRPVLGWLGAAAWPQIFVALTSGLLTLLFVAGAAPVLARKQRYAPVCTLSLGILLLSALILPGLGLALIGWLGPALLVTALITLLLSLGLSVSVYDAGRTLASRLRLPAPDVTGALLGLSAFAASLSYAPLAFGLALIGGVWGAGTLLLSRSQLQLLPPERR